MVGEEERTTVVTDGRLPVLVVDDRPESLVALEAVLVPLGLEVVTAGSGEEALRLLLEHDFSLILLDVRMPGLDGLETAALIKSRERTRDIPIVFLTAAEDDLANIIRGYGMGAVDYVLKPFDPELLRSKIAVFAELGEGRRLLKSSEAFLQGAFHAAPIGKTVLDFGHRIVRANPAFARMVGRSPEELEGVQIADLCHSEDREALATVLDQASAPGNGGHADDLSMDLRLLKRTGAVTWVAPAASQIEPSDLLTQLLLVQWVDVSSRRRAEQAAADLLLEQAARTHAEAQAERLEKLHRLTAPTRTRSLADLLTELARRIAQLFDADTAEIETAENGPGSMRATGGHVRRPALSGAAPWWQEMELAVEGSAIGTLRLAFAEEPVTTVADRQLLRQAADQISLMIRRAQLDEHERRVAVELQRGLLPTRPPKLPGVAIAAELEAAGLGAEVGGDWYDTFELPGRRLGVVIGDVTGSGIKAASAMGQLRSVTRAFAVGDPDPPSPAEVLTRVQRYHATVGFEQLFTVLYLILDVSGGTVVWANAGHPPPLLRAADGEVRVLTGHDSMMCRAEVTFDDRKEPVREGDVLVLYTDGLIERHGEAIDDGIERLAQALKRGPSEPDLLCAHLIDEIRGAASEHADDVTAVVIGLTDEAATQPGGEDPSRRVQVTLAPDPNVPAMARRMLERSFGGSLDRDELERAKLAISELATNAVRHGEGEVTVLAELDGERLLVEVIDQGSGFEHVVRENDFDAVGGWGLKVVDAETSRWGVHDGTTHVWFEIERRGPRVGVEQRLP